MKRSFYGRYSIAILCAVAFLFFPIFGGALHALRSNRNDVKEWLPAQYEETTLFQWFRQHFAGDEFILMSWKGCTLDDERIPQMAERLEAAVADWTPAGQLKKPLFKQIVTGPDTLARLIDNPTSLDENLAIERLKGSLIGPDGNQTCLVLTLDEAGKEKPRPTVALVRRTAEECGIAAADLHLGGPPIDNVAIDEAGESSLFKLAGAAGAIGLIISWWCLRSGHLITMVFSAGILAAAASLAAVWYTNGTMNAILLTMPSLVYVATISGAIHFSNYYRDTLYEQGYHNAPGNAIKHARLPLSLATLTTAVGLLTLYISELTPIQMFGVYSAIGVVISLLFLFLFLPAAFQTLPLRIARRPVAAERPKRRLADPLLSKRWRLAGRFVVRHNGLVVAACVLLLAGLGVGMSRLETSVHLMRLFPPDARILADYKWLEENLGDLVPMEVVLKIDRETCPLTVVDRMELVEAVHQRLTKEVDEVGSALSAVTFAPELNIGASSGITGKFARQNLEHKLASSRSEFLGSGYLAEDGSLDLWRVSARVGALRDVDYGLFLNDIKREITPVIALARQYAALSARERATLGLGAYLRRNRKTITPEFAAAALAAEFPDRSADDGPPPAAGEAGITPVFTGLVPLIYKAQRSLLDGLIFGFVTDFILITIVMIVAVRSLAAGAILALPSIFPAIFVFGSMGWMGIIVDIGTVMAPAVALGVTVDDIVHFMVQFRNAMHDGKNRRQAVMQAYKGCARAMYQSWGVIGLGLSVFALSPFTPTQRFGYMMVTLLTSALIGNLLLLPALLAGPLGAWFGRGVVRRKEKARQIRTHGPHGPGPDELHGQPSPVRIDGRQEMPASESGRTASDRVESNRPSLLAMVRRPWSWLALSWRSNRRRVA